MLELALCVFHVVFLSNKKLKASKTDCRFFVPNYKAQLIRIRCQALSFVKMLTPRYRYLLPQNLSPSIYLQLLFAL